MTATIGLTATPIVGWDEPDAAWEQARKQGLGASSAATVLGFIKWRTPWQVWAEKTGTRRPPDQPSSAAQLGVDLEPWLLDQATTLLDRPVTRTPHRMYAHPTYPWRLCSPDGWVPADRRLVEAKTAGIGSGYGIPHGWDDDRVPLGYEVQCRWQMHVMDVDVVEVVALVAGMGLLRRTVHRNPAIEIDLVAQVDEWWHRYVVGGQEPPFEANDNDTVAFLYPQSNQQAVDLDDTDAAALIGRRIHAAERKQLAETEIALIDTRLKALLGDNELGRIDGRVAYTWAPRKGRMNWQRLIDDLTTNGVSLPDLDTYRKPPTRTLTVKDLTR